MKKNKSNSADWQEAINFWFNEINSEQWFKKDETFDKDLKNRFLDLHRQASKGELYGWRDSIEGRLAEIIVLDQFSRNIFRDKPESFAQDSAALILAQEALKSENITKLTTAQRAFVYMPFMHSESSKIHQKSLDLFTGLGDENYLHYEKLHKDIIDRFGRYPHRNKVLDRKSTTEEIEFLKQPNSSF